MSITVRPINQEILGMSGTNNLINQTIPGIGLINIPSFRPGQRNNAFSFGFAPMTSGRLGLFAAGKNNSERVVIVLLPQNATPDGLLICITQGFGQAADRLIPMGWSNPLSKPFVEFALLKHVINRWGAQMLASPKNLALIYILRAAGSHELGPFTRDGDFFYEVMSQISSLTNNSFPYNTAEAFTFSSGISDFNNFIGPVSRNININAVYSIDPAHSLPIANPSGGIRKQYASGTAGGILHGFEPMELQRWTNESEYASHRTIGRFEYLHNRCLPLYTLHLALSTP